MGKIHNYNHQVCIQCYTYNQAQYITDTLNGFAMQQTSFPFIAVVVDDASTDGEQKVIASYVEENFDTTDQAIAYHEETDYAHITFAQHKSNKSCYIAVLYLKENHYQKGQNRKKLEYLAQWRDDVKYVALCEGDDYWIDPLKLQKQVDFLEANPDHAMVCTLAQMYRQEKGELGRIMGDSGNFDFKSILVSNPICTLTVLMRRDMMRRYVEDIQPQIRGWRLGDLPMWLYFAAESKIGFIPDVTAVYRLLPESASHSRDYDKIVTFLRSAVDVDLFFAERYAPELIGVVEKGAARDEFYVAYDVRNHAAVIECYKRIVDKGYVYTPKTMRTLRRKVLKSRLRLLWSRIVRR